MKGLEFYSAAAQVIPLLFVVALIEMRLFGFTAYPGARLHRSFWLALVVLGEARALWVLHDEGTVTFIDPGLVAMALAVAAMPLVLTAFGQLFPDHVRPGHPARRHLDAGNEEP